MEFILLDILVGLNVSDEENYKKYRLEMTPLLHSIGGKFKYDFTIKETLINHSENEINRVFIISFPNLKSKEDFFSKPEYVSIKEKYFNGSVESTTILLEADNTR